MSLTGAKRTWPPLTVAAAFDPKRRFVTANCRIAKGSITSSAVPSNLFDTVIPSAFAVLRLILSSNLVGACTGRRGLQFDVTPA
jgi:hypothetical protein